MIGTEYGSHFPTKIALLLVTVSVHGACRFALETVNYTSLTGNCAVPVCKW
jgi:hypothetical protein